MARAKQKPAKIWTRHSAHLVTFRATRERNSNGRVIIMACVIPLCARRVFSRNKSAGRRLLSQKFHFACALIAAAKSSSPELLCKVSSLLLSPSLPSRFFCVVPIEIGARGMSNSQAETASARENSGNFGLSRARLSVVWRNLLPPPRPEASLSGVADLLTLTDNLFTAPSRK